MLWAALVNQIPKVYGQSFNDGILFFRGTKRLLGDAVNDRIAILIGISVGGINNTHSGGYPQGFEGCAGASVDHACIGHRLTLRAVARSAIVLLCKD